MAKKPDIFLDTSALFAGVWSGSGGARQILKLAEAGLVIIHVSPQVLSELENNLRRKAPNLVGKLAVLFDQVGLHLVKPAPGPRFEAALELTGHAGDARVLADAREAGVDFFVTLDREHFLDNQALTTGLPFQMGTPGDFLLWYRQNFIADGA